LIGTGGGGGEESKRVHVLFFTEDFPDAEQAAGGLRVSIRKQAEGLAERCRVTVVEFRPIMPPLRRYADSRILDGAGGVSQTGRRVTADPPKPEKGASRGLHVLRYSYLHVPVLWPLTEPLQLVMLGMVAFLRHARDADLMHGHSIYAMGVPAAFVGLLTRRPSVSSAYGTEINWLDTSRRLVRFWVRETLRRSTRVIGVSQGLLAKAAELGVGADRRRYVPSGVDLRRFQRRGDPASLRHELGLPGDAHIFLAVNLFFPAKGHSVLVEAFRRLSGRRPESYLVMTADGPLRGEITEQVARAGLADRVRFTGLLNHEDIPPFIAASDTLVMPSLSEGMPLAVLEAFASGKPVVGTTAGGIPELVSDERYGIVVPPSDPEAFARAMEAAMDRTWNADLLRARAEEFSWPAVVDKLFAVYKEIVP
jgi:glycosyltransferase involved in cell wall biosynthesis